jgi:hypothetical protein
MNDNTWSLKDLMYVAGVLVVIVGGVFTAYWNVMQVVSSQQQTMASWSARLDMVEKSQRDANDRDDRFAAEMRAAMSQINAGVSDLRVQEAGRNAPAKK